MKKIIFIVIAGLAFSACKKQNPATADVETIDVTLEGNGSYQHALPAADNAEISSNAAHASLSKVAIVPGATTASTYSYVPAEGYTGTDEVTITVTNCHPQNGAQQGPPPGKEECGQKRPSQEPKNNCNKSDGSTANKKIVFRFKINQPVLN